MRSSRGRAGSDGLNETKTEPKPGTAVDVVPPRAGEPASGHGAAGTGRQPGGGGPPCGPWAGQTPAGPADGARAAPRGGTVRAGWGGRAGP